mmetsp:Transcript_54609/g.109820  ORF Transcript_54609/g.109820 Transcript_54609/m.109820 type:complete len:216 (+) Transcript_54609:1-648(+)
MKTMLLIALVGSVSAFTTAPGRLGCRGVALNVAKTTGPQSLNGWKPDAKAFAWGLPGSIEPFVEFDPLGFTDSIQTVDEMKRYREAEVTHGRVAMLAALGFLVGERFHPLFGLAKEEILGMFVKFCLTSSSCLLLRLASRSSLARCRGGSRPRSGGRAEPQGIFSMTTIILETLVLTPLTSGLRTPRSLKSWPRRSSSTAAWQCLRLLGLWRKNL